MHGVTDRKRRRTVVINAFHRCKNDCHTGSDKKKGSHVSSRHNNTGIVLFELNAKISLKRVQYLCNVMADYKIKVPR